MVGDIGLTWREQEKHFYFAANGPAFEVPGPTPFSLAEDGKLTWLSLSLLYVQN